MLAQYKNLDSALANGIKQVDIVLYGDYMSSGNYNGSLVNNLYNESKRVGNLGYINASVGLGYMTGFFYNFRAAISFRAAKSIFNPSDASRKDFYNNTGNEILGDSTVALGTSFIEYYDGDTAIKAGRFQPISPWVNHLIDGVWLRNGSFRNVVIEGIWAYNYGRVTYYEISPFRRLDTTGWFNVGLTYYFNGDGSDFKNLTSVNAFSTFIPGVFATIGARAHWASSYNGGTKWWIGVDGGIAGSFEDHISPYSFNNNTFLFDSKFMIGYQNIDVMVGYLASGDAGMGSLGILGVGNGMQSDSATQRLTLQTFYSNIQPFFVWGGRAIKMGRNAQLVYAATRLSFFDNRLKAYLAYGATFFDGSKYYGGNHNGLVQNELNVMLDFGITKTLNVFTQISSTHFGKYVPNVFELNGGFRFMF